MTYFDMGDRVVATDSKTGELIHGVVTTVFRNEDSSPNGVVRVTVTRRTGRWHEGDQLDMGAVNLHLAAEETQA